jgi:hypothetical protein
MELIRMETEIPEEKERESAPLDAEWDQRVLCSDGNCIGVIGPDGNCKECGKKFEGTLPEELASESEESPPADIPDEEEDVPPEELPHHVTDNNDDWQNRILCSDGNCIGIIGPDGRCKECGKPYEGEMANDE